MIEAIFVMWQRQIKTYLRSKHRMIGSLAQPLLFLLAFGFGFGPVFEKAGNGNYIQYLIPGIIGMTLLFSSIMNGMSLIWDKQFGFLKETLVAPVSRTNLLFGRCLGGATTSTFQGIIVLLISFLMGFRIQSIPLFLLGIMLMFLISFMFTLIGTSIASKVDDMQAFPTIINFLIMPMFFLSGALFPIENLPAIIKTLSLFNPVRYSVELLHFALDTSSSYNFGVSFSVIVGLILVLAFIGTRLFNKIET